AGHPEEPELIAVLIETERQRNHRATGPAPEVISAADSESQLTVMARQQALRRADARYRAEQTSDDQTPGQPQPLCRCLPHCAPRQSTSLPRETVGKKLVVLRCASHPDLRGSRDPALAGRSGYHFGVRRTASGR